ncbi:hypothetical protein DNU06_16275 [Putridiphycobacter roseus]|uniref:Uncharacterized protein n=1 Tax=Putridiphycobacter roseus TaxID=2219161 RepID=A0A2W1NMH3_9FLAO|nr:hypothetical protein [Putridiphycobacter roseus]PZE15828.1 hypothetical protein DNU06_16275 [Putridiphycobacter roseus]
MKTIQKLILLFSTALFFLSASCEKQDPEPEFTQGFSCKINGVEWVAKTPTSISGPVPLLTYYDQSVGNLQLKATRKNSENNIYDVINIVANNIYESGKYEMETEYSNKDKRVGFHDNENNFVCDVYFHDSLSPGHLKICKFDKTNRELSGTFNMTLINTDCIDSLMYITDGKFAFRY